MTNTKAIATSLTVVILSIGALANTGCSVETPSDESASTADALANTGGGTTQGYTCTDAGYCQCRGLEDCDDMFRICKSHTYCNYDTQGGFRCCCWNFETMQTGGFTRPTLGGATTVTTK